jgi:hypothetical protein
MRPVDCGDGPAGAKPGALLSGRKANSITFFPTAERSGGRRF